LFEKIKLINVIYLIVIVVAFFCLNSTFGADSTEDIFWESVKKSDTVVEYKLYVEKYPKGKYANEAHLRITMLQPNNKLEPPLTIKPDVGSKIIIKNNNIQNNLIQKQKIGNKLAGQRCDGSVDCADNLACNKFDICFDPLRENWDGSKIESLNSTLTGSKLIGQRCNGSVDCFGNLACNKFDVCFDPSQESWDGLRY
jgi:hypothetical protein